MANIQIRRYDGSDWQDIYPKTTAANIISGTLNADRIPSLNASKINAGTFDAARIPNLDASKITSGTLSASLLPASVIGGMKFHGTTTGSVSIDDITGNGTNELNSKGQYLICTGGVSLTQGSTVTGTVQAPGDEGDSTLPIGLEAGDWIIALTDLSGNAITIGIINNTYRDASSSDKGIVQLSSQTAYASLSGNNVVTEGVLKTVIDNAGFQAGDAGLTDIAGLSPNNSTFIVGDGSNWVAESGSTARTSLGLGSLATASTISNANWSGTDLAVENGGTGAGTASGARTNLGLAIGSDVQAYDADLATIAGLAKTNGNFIVGNGSAWVAESGSTARASLGLSIGSDVQAYDADLAAIGALAKTNGNFIVGNGSTWVAESGATARASLSVDSSTEVNTKIANFENIFYGTQTFIEATSATTGNLGLQTD